MPSGEEGCLGPFLERWINIRDQRAMSQDEEDAAEEVMSGKATLPVLGASKGQRVNNR